jgi:hypothetical protein
MKKLLLLVLAILPITLFAQFTTINPDTVCINDPFATYQVPNTPNYTYVWSVSAPGILTSGQGTNEITVDWSAAPAGGPIVDAISVYATTPAGCDGPPITMNVFILEINPVVTPLVFCEGDPCEDLVATPAGGVFSGPNIVNGQYCPQTEGTETVTYTITEAGCTFTATADMTVYPIPVLDNISHD